jgi:hypothetical protein
VREFSKGYANTVRALIDSSTFRGMFDEAQRTSSTTNEIELDESALNLEIFFDKMHRIDQTALGHDNQKPSLDSLLAIIYLSTEFDFTSIKAESKAELREKVKTSPFDVLAFASHQGNLHLGRVAIQHIKLENGAQGKDLWALTCGLVPLWRMAFLQLVIPSLVLRDTEHKRQYIDAQCKTNMSDVAYNFNPWYVAF